MIDLTTLYCINCVLLKLWTFNENGTLIIYILLLFKALNVCVEFLEDKKDEK